MTYMTSTSKVSVVHSLLLIPSYVIHVNNGLPTLDKVHFMSWSSLNHPVITFFSLLVSGLGNRFIKLFVSIFLEI